MNDDEFCIYFEKVKKMLTIDQNRSLGICLGIMEEELNRLHRLLHEGKEGRLFSHITDDLTKEEKLFINRKIERLRECLIYLKNFFDLRHSQQEMTLRGMVKAISLYLSVNLEGRKSTRLKGYGKVDPALKDSLDPKLDEMISILGEMESIK